ncbi:hypothetical protein HD806DRAFT_541888 [Xylariaceae sp. AK1471]|nr:hypothetical protein HD806DRAFT_541888 [Xylariaceae sp. AK1471]
MAPVTEVVLMTLVPDADYNLILESAKIMAQQPGCLTVRTSRQHQDPNKAHFFIDWDSVDSHMVFARNKEIYGPFRELVGTFMAGYAQPYHVSLSPYPPAALDHHNQGGGAGKSRVAMVGQAWFPSGDDDLVGKGKGEEKVSRAFEAFVEALNPKSSEGFSGEVSQGWSLEEDIRNKDETGRVFFFAVGWDSFEAYERFRDSEDFEKIMSVVSGLEGLRDLELWGVSTAETTA